MRAFCIIGEEATMRIRDMLAAAVRPWISVQSNEKSVKITLGNGGRGRPHVSVVVRDARSGHLALSLWPGSRWLSIGDLMIGAAHSESWRRVKRPANDSQAA